MYLSGSFISTFCSFISADYLSCSYSTTSSNYCLFCLYISIFYFSYISSIYLSSYVSCIPKSYLLYLCSLYIIRLVFY